MIAANFPKTSALVSAKLDGENGLRKTGGDTVTLSGANTFTGGVTISDGVLQLGSTGALNSTSRFWT